MKSNSAFYRHALITKAYKRIKVLEQNYSLAESFEAKLKIHPVLARIMAARGFKNEHEIYNYLKPTLRNGLIDKAKLKNLDAAAKTIADHVSLKQKIGIACDFDVDGISSAAMLFLFLQKHGCEPEIFIPDRFQEGYGLNTRIINEAHKKNIALLITLDFGTSNFVELELAKKLGIKTIVVDHHSVAALPPTDIFVNPKQIDCNFADQILCTAGITWYLILALRDYLKDSIDPRLYLDLAAIGTICDLVALTGVNRTIVARGLEYLDQTSNIGLIALKQIVGISNIKNASQIGFGLGPRINAAGRMGKAKLAFELLTTNSETEAKKLAKKLDQLNTERQEIEKKQRDLAFKEVFNYDNMPYGIIACNSNYHSGIIGILAQRLTEFFYRPSTVLSLENGVYKGSLRTVKGISAINLLTSLSEFFISFGGHDGAGGFKLNQNQLENFKLEFNKVCKDMFQFTNMEPLAYADTQLEFRDIDLNLIQALTSCAPFGMSNSAPCFLIEKAKVRTIKELQSKHLQISLSQEDKFMTGLFWNETYHPALQVGYEVNLLCKPDLNEYQGRQTIRLNLIAVEAA